MEWYRSGYRGQNRGNNHVAHFWQADPVNFSQAPKPAGAGHELKPGSELTYARYGLWNYVRPEKQKADPYQELHRAGINLRGLIRVMLFRRFESSVHAFRKSLERLERIHGFFLEALDRGPGKFVFCQAGKYQQLYLTDADGNPETREVPAVLGKLKCSRTEPTALLPAGHNGTVMKVLKVFESEVKHRQAQLKHGLSLTTSQVYVLRELRAIYSRLADEETDLKAQVAKLEEAFKKPVTAAIRRQLNTLRRNGVIGNPLVRSLADIYHDHGLHEQIYEDRRLHEQEAEGLPRIICSEAFV
jgi:hypothetical protein